MFGHSWASMQLWSGLFMQYHDTCNFQIRACSCPPTSPSSVFQAHIFFQKKHKKQTQPTQNARTITQISRKPTKMSHKQKSLQYHVNHQTSPNQPIFPPNSSCPFVATWRYWVRSALLYWQFYGWSIPHCPCTCWHEVPGIPPKGDPNKPAGFFLARARSRGKRRGKTKPLLDVYSSSFFSFGKKKQLRNPTKSKFGKIFQWCCHVLQLNSSILYTPFLGSSESEINEFLPGE